MIGWFRKWWPWGREAPAYDWTEMSFAWCVSPERLLWDELSALQIRHKAAIKAKKKRSHIEARMKEIRTELLRMEAGK